MAILTADARLAEVLLPVHTFTTSSEGASASSQMSDGGEHLGAVSAFSK